MMKKKLLFAYLLFVCLSAQAQTSELEYRPFAQEGKNWQAQVGGIKESHYAYLMEGDTLIHGEYWKKVYNYQISSQNTHRYFAAIRDTGKKVYAIAKGSDRSRLLYDFSIKKGDMVRCGVEGNSFGCLLDTDEQPDTLLGFPFKAYLKVERIDTITGWEGAVFRRFILSSLNSYKEYLYDDEERKITGDVVWLEGIGSSAGLFLPWQPLQPRGVVLLNCHSDAFYAATPDFEYKNTTVPVTSSYSDVRQDSFSYDLQGRPLSTPPSRGMYIQNRKKVIK